jgi:uncharacterized membrane-anchored protein
MMLATLLFSLALAQSTPTPEDATPAQAAPTDAAATDTDAANLVLPADPKGLRDAIRLELKAGGAPDAALEDQVEHIAARIELERSLTPTTGDVVLRDGLATLHLGADYQFLPSEQAAKIIVAWGNPPPTQPPLGMILAAGASPFTDAWAVILDYDDQGHVDDAEAASMDFDALLKEMQEGTQGANEARQAAGYDSLELVGWAEPPHYDAVAKKLYWAQHLKSSTGESLNYDIRVLGRRGVLSLSAVSDMAALADVKAGMSALLPLVEFNPGESYADFDPSTDKLAAVGIGALIAGGLATKAGFFKMLFVGLLAGKKFVFLGLAAAAAAFNSWRGVKSNDPKPPVS